MKTVVPVVCALLLCAAELAQSQGEPLCSQLTRETEDTLYHNFPRNSLPTSTLVEHKCVTRNGRNRVLYSCGKDASAVLTDAQGNTRDISPSTNTVNLRREGLTLECLPLSPSVQPPVAPVVEGGDVETRKQTTGCPSVAPSSKLSFHIASRGRVCERKCIVRTSTFGLIQERVRTYYTCCSGDVPTPYSRALNNFYECPSSPGKPEGPPAETPLPPVDRIRPLLPEITRPVPAVTNRPPAVTNGPPAEISGPSTDMPACSSVSVRPKSRSSFHSGSGDVCERKCTFKTSTFGHAQERINTYYSCCSGDVPTPFSRALPGFYICPS